MTFSGKHPQPPQHLEEAQEGISHGQIPAQDPTKCQCQVNYASRNTGMKEAYQDNY